MDKIAVIGAGVMGQGVSSALAQFDYQVVLVDLNEEILEKAKKSIQMNLKMSNFSRKEKLDIDGILSNITFAQSLEQIKDADIVIENITEDYDAKEKVYQQLEGICKEEAIIMVNTSCISITKLASLTSRQDKIIGTHFMNPVPMIHSVETIMGFYTSKETLEKTKDFMKSIGKTCIVVNDMAGFVSNRISHLIMNEAAFIVQDQVAKPEDVDEIFRSCYGHKMGPLETLDLIGVDTVVHSLKVLYDEFQDPKFRCCPLLKKMVAAKKLGRKNGEGFYKYY